MLKDEAAIVTVTLSDPCLRPGTDSAKDDVLIFHMQMSMQVAPGKDLGLE